MAQTTRDRYRRIDYSVSIQHSHQKAPKRQAIGEHLSATFHRWGLGQGDVPLEGALRVVFDTWRESWNEALHRYGAFKEGDSVEASSFLAFDEVTALMHGNGACIALTLQRACNPAELSQTDREYFARLPSIHAAAVLAGGPLWITAFFTVAPSFRNGQDGDPRWIQVYLELLARRFTLSSARRMCVAPSRKSKMHLAVRMAGARLLVEDVDYHIRGHRMDGGVDVAQWEQGPRDVDAGLTSDERRLVQVCWDQRIGFDTPLVKNAKSSVNSGEIEELL